MTLQISSYITNAHLHHISLTHRTQLLQVWKSEMDIKYSISIFINEEHDI